jgi:capsular polysaccharide biosynthesis protein
VVVLADVSQRDAVQPWLERFGSDEVHVVAPAEAPEWQLDETTAEYVKASSLSHMGVVLKRLGPVDIVVSLLSAGFLPGQASDQYDVFERVFRHINRGGAFILDRSTAVASTSRSGIEHWTQLMAAVEDPAAAAKLRKRDAELAESAGTVILSRDLIVVTKRRTHYLKLREADVTPILTAREPALRWRELEGRSGLVFESRASVTSHGDLVSADSFPAQFDVPPVKVRHYQGRIGSPGASLLFTGRTILPDSFRWHLTQNPTNSRLASVSPDFARIASRFVPKRRLPGTYYSLDCSNSGHFGHLTTEIVSKLWGWDRAKQEFPDLKAFFHLKPKTQRVPRLEQQLFTAYGVPEADIVWVNEPVWLESVVSATPLWHNESPFYVHPEIQDVWSRIGDGLLRTGTDLPTYDRIFVSRRLRHRRCRNRAAVERFFEQRGFTVVFPERFSLPEQASMFGNAKIIAGFAGSAMFNLMHARRMETTIVLSHNCYTARNEHLFTSVLGGDVHYFWSRAAIQHPEGGFSKEAFFSAWEFDLDRYHKELDAVIDGS